MLGEIEQFFGEECAAYVSRKHRGGVNGTKGVLYEHYYAALKLAEELSKVVEGGNAAQIVEGQIIGFVDDLAVRGEARDDLFQCKNVERISWGAGTGSLADDFAKQGALAAHLNHPVGCTVVVPSPELRDALYNTMPDGLAEFTHVDHYPDLKKVDRFLRESPRTKEVLRRICAKPSPTIADLTTILNQILALWIAWGGRADPDELARQLWNISGVCLAHPNSLLIPGNLREILDSVAGLEFRVARGYFHWSYRLVDSGTFRYPCDSDAFRRFSEWILTHHPFSYDELGGWLLT